MGPADTLEWAAVSEAKRQGHPHVTDAHVVIAACNAGIVPEEFAAALRARGEPFISALPRTFDSPSLGESANSLLSDIASRGIDETLRDWLAAFPPGPSGRTAEAGRPEDRATAEEGVGPTSAQPSTDAAGLEGREQVLSRAVADLDSLIGLASVKEHVRGLADWQRWNAARADAGLPSTDASLHMVFTGPPGTGKTTVARIVARILFGLGALESDRVTEVSRPDLVAEHVGGTSVKTQKVLDRATGGVLFIDEAYSLTPDGFRGGADYGAEAVASLLRHLENHRGRIAVIVAGYENDMGRFLDSNPGLRSRFGTTIAFPRYSTDELVDIFEVMAEGHGLNHDDKVVAAVRQRLARSGSGNARAVRTLIEQATRRMATRAMADGEITAVELQDLLVEDILGTAGSAQRQESLAAAMADLDALVGLDEVKQHVRDLVARQMWTRARIDAGMTVPDEGMHLVFTGAPGTGKTSVARIIAHIYQGLGLLDSGHLVEATRKDLVGHYVGQTAATTQAVLDRASGGVLFIDEAYSLAGAGQSDFGPEAIATLLSHMEDNRGSVAVIAAGYGREMEAFLSSNPGLSSRFGTTIEFLDYSTEELVEIFQALCVDQGLECGKASLPRYATTCPRGQRRQRPIRQEVG